MTSPAFTCNTTARHHLVDYSKRPANTCINENDTPLSLKDSRRRLASCNNSQASRRIPECVFVGDPNHSSEKATPTISFKLRKSSLLNFLEMNSSDSDIEILDADERTEQSETLSKSFHNKEKKDRRDNLKRTLKKTHSVRTLGLNDSPLTEPLADRPIATPLRRSHTNKGLLRRSATSCLMRPEQEANSPATPKTLRRTYSKNSRTIQRQRSFVTASRIRRIDFMH